MRAFALLAIAAALAGCGVEQEDTKRLLLLSEIRNYETEGACQRAVAELTREKAWASCVEASTSTVQARGCRRPTSPEWFQVECRRKGA